MVLGDHTPLSNGVLGMAVITSVVSVMTYFISGILISEPIHSGHRSLIVSVLGAHGRRDQRADSERMTLGKIGEPRPPDSK